MSEEQGLKDAGLKITAPRLKILQLQSRRRCGTSVQKMCTSCCWRMVRDWTCDRLSCLNPVEDAGLVARHHLRGHSVFELSPDQHHDHIVCVKCGKVEEFNDVEIERRQKMIAESLGLSSPIMI